MSYDQKEVKDKDAHTFNDNDRGKDIQIEYKHRKNCECCPGHSLTVSQPSKSLSL